MSELPKGWVSTKIQEVSENVKYGYTASTSWDNSGVKFLRITDIQDDKVDWESVPWCDIDNSDLIKFALEKDDIVFARTGATVGKSFLIKSISHTSVFASYLIRLRTNKAVKPSFIRYFFDSKNYWRQISESSSGIGQPNVNASKLKELNFPLPPLAEQERIVEKLDGLFASLDVIKDKLDRIPELLKNFRQQVLTQAVTGKLTEEWRETSDFNSVGVFDIPSNWVFKTVNEVSESLKYGSSSKSDDEGEIPVLRMGNLQKGKLDWKDLKFSSNPEEIKKYKLSPGDILFNRTNSPELVGKTSIYRGEQKAIYAGYLIRIRVSDQVEPEYLNHMLNTDYAKNWCLSVKSDGVSQSNINAKKLGAFEVPIPPVEEQQEIVLRVEELFAIADRVEARYTTLKEKVDKLPQAILAKAFRGELVEQDENDEPAEVLLERIKAEREKNEGKAKRKGGKN